MFDHKLLNRTDGHGGYYNEPQKTENRKQKQIKFIFQERTRKKETKSLNI